MTSRTDVKKLLDHIDILDNPGHGLASRDVVASIALRLLQTKKGKVKNGYVSVPEKALAAAEKSGMFPDNWRQSVDEFGSVIWVQSAGRNEYYQGDLLFTDSLYAVEKALSMYLNPLCHIHIYYVAYQIVVHPHYAIYKSWAESVNPFRTYFMELTPEEKQMNDVQPGDIAIKAYNISDSDLGHYLQFLGTLSQNADTPREAQRFALDQCAKGTGIGILKANEMVKDNGDPLEPPKGRGWPWKAEKRAITAAIRFSHGEMSPLAGQDFALGKGIAVTGKELTAIANDPYYPADASPEVQERYLQSARRSANISISPKEAKKAAQVMWDDTPID